MEISTYSKGIQINKPRYLSTEGVMVTVCGEKEEVPENDGKDESERWHKVADG